MPKIYETTHTHPYPLPAVSLAYYLRYPNPLSPHVLSTDTISRSFDPATQRLHIVRLHLKRSKLPTALLRLLPKGFIGGGGGGGEKGGGGGGNGTDKGGEGKSYVLETSTVDVKEGWMQTESRNLEYTGLLSVVERARYERPAGGPPREASSALSSPSSSSSQTSSQTSSPPSAPQPLATATFHADAYTRVTTAVTFHSRFGQALRSKREAHGNTAETNPPAAGFLQNLTTGRVQVAIEGLGVTRAKTTLAKSKEGMNVVLERMKVGGLKGVLEGMRRDREGIVKGTLAPGVGHEGRGGLVEGQGKWARVWGWGKGD